MNQGRLIRVRGDMSRSEAKYRVQKTLFSAGVPVPTDPRSASGTESVLN